MILAIVEQIFLFHVNNKISLIMAIEGSRR